MIAEIIVELERDINTKRRILTLIVGERFDRLYETSTQKDQILETIRLGDENTLRELLKLTARRDYNSLNMVALRQIAAGLGVPYYARLDKHQLISEIIGYEGVVRDTLAACPGSGPIGGLGHKPY